MIRVGIIYRYIVLAFFFVSNGLLNSSAFVSRLSYFGKFLIYDRFENK